MARGRRRGRNGGQFANDFVKAFLMARKQFADEDFQKLRGEKLKAEIDRLRGNTGGMSEDAMAAHVRQYAGGGARSGGASGARGDGSSPVDGTFAGGPRSGYGADRGGGRIHAGVDWQAANGSPAHSVVDGKVVYVGAHSGYGNTVDVLGKDGHVHRYALHEGRVGVRIGDEIQRGQQIGTVGGGHVHNEIIRNGSDAWKAATSGRFGQTSRVGGRSDQTINPQEYYRLNPGARVTAGGMRQPPQRSTDGSPAGGSLGAYGMPRSGSSAGTSAPGTSRVTPPARESAVPPAPQQRSAEPEAPRAPEPEAPSAPESAIPSRPPSMLEQPFPRVSELEGEQPVETADSQLDNASMQTADALGLGSDETSLEALPPVEMADVAPDAALDLGFGFDDFSVFAAEGGAIDQPAMDYPEIVGIALKATQDDYGLGQEQAALPGTDPERQQDLEAFAMNANATPPEEMLALLRSVDPNGEMSPGAATAAAMQQVFGHYAQQGDQEAGAQAVSQILQASRARSMKLGSLAMAALEGGDLPGAGKALVAAYNQIPDGRTAEGQVDAQGNGMVVVKDDSGKPVQEMRVNPQLLKIAADRLASGNEFYTHMAQLTVKPAAPSGPGGGGGGGQPRSALPTPQYNDGGYVGDGYDYEDPDLQEADDRYRQEVDAETERSAAALYATEGSEDPPPPPGAQDVRRERPDDDRAAIPPAPEPVPYHPQMSAPQRRMIDRFNGDRMREWQQQSALIRQERRQAVSAENQRAQQARAQAFTQQQTTERMREQQDRQRSTQMAVQGRADARTAAVGRQRLEDFQRRQNNGMTEDEMRQEYVRAAAGAVPAVALQADVALGGSRLKEPALPLGVTGGEANYRNPSSAMVMPAEASRPRSVGDIRQGVQNAFDREFAMTPESRNLQIAARDVRDRALEERDLTAADIAARSNRKDRGAKLEDAIDSFIDDDKDGLFVREAREGEKAGENGKVFFGDKIPPGEKASMKMWTFKMAQANPDMPISAAARAVYALSYVDDKDPRMAPPYTIKVDDKGRGRVQLKDGSVAFNLDRESLQQIALVRRAKVLKAQQGLSDVQAKAERSRNSPVTRAGNWLSNLVNEGAVALQPQNLRATREQAVGRILNQNTGSRSQTPSGRSNTEEMRDLTGGGLFP